MTGTATLRVPRGRGEHECSRRKPACYTNAIDNPCENLWDLAEYGMAEAVKRSPSQGRMSEDRSLMRT